MPKPVTAREPAPAPNRAIGRLAVAVEALHQRLLSAEQDDAERLATIPAARRMSARNLLHYVALRSQDLRRLQRDLALNGLSSLGRCEAHVLASVEQLRRALQAMLGQHDAAGVVVAPSVDHNSGPRELSRQAQVVFGPSPAARAARIMVTLPGESANDPDLIERLMGAGMDLARINCAHDDERVWSQMIRLVRDTAAAHGRPCRILMDLAGPKLRTGPLAGGEAVVSWSPQRDHLGRVVAPARVALVSGDHQPAEVLQAVPLTVDLSRTAAVGDQVVFRDARKKRRRGQVVQVAPQEVIIETDETAYVVPGTVIRLERAGRRLLLAEVAALPTSDEPLVLAVGDTLVVTADQVPGRPARRDDMGRVSEPACVPCSLPEVVAQVRVGERICFDDGKIDAVVRQADAKRLVVEITRAREGGAKLRSDKGINLPDSELTLPCLTTIDLQHLEFAKRHADLIGLSFVHHASDVAAVVAALGKMRRQIGVVLKIETPQAFKELPEILLTALGRIPMGVMVARGDLAVEVGFARLAEVQEEILWLCEAAHLPVIWGTQVLETLAKKGMATRAEVTDAAMSVRAECVMLNKGPHIVEAVLFLDDVLVRMQEHQSKKRTLLRRLGVTNHLRMKQGKHHA